MIIDLLIYIVQAFFAILFVRIIFTWIRVNPWSKMAKVERILIRITDPVLVPIRRMLPPLRIGGMGLDLSPMVLFIALDILLNVLRSR